MPWSVIAECGHNPKLLQTSKTLESQLYRVAPKK